MQPGAKAPGQLPGHHHNLYTSFGQVMDSYPWYMGYDTFSMD